jgi:hypothetical protein
MSEVTHVLDAIEGGDPSAGAQLLPLVYNELRKLAAAKLALEKPGQTVPVRESHSTFPRLVHSTFPRLVHSTFPRLVHLVF